MSSSHSSATGAGASTRAIEHHYDVGNDFYATFLDENLVYSCALWQEGDALHTAQLRKLDYHLEQSRARAARRILDVGCGWGALLQRARVGHGVAQATGLTLSRAQHHYITTLGLPGTEVLLESWQNHTPRAPYDAIVSIGAFEHFAKPDLTRPEREAGYREFFERCWQWLVPGGRLSLQTITYDNMPAKAMSRFIADAIFPESDLPKLSEISEASDGLFSVLVLRNDAGDYEETCRHWLRRLRANRQRAVDLAGEANYQLYVRYLTLVMMGFHVRNMGLLRMTLVRLDKAYRAP